MLRNQNGKPSRRHINILFLSKQDDVMLCAAVQDRFLLLLASYQKIKGVELVPPTSLDADMLRWRQMVVRFKQQDLRHTEAEMSSLKTIAQWTVDTNREMRNQEAKSVEWKET